MLSKRYESTEVDCRTWQHVPLETLWSTSSETHQVDKILRRDLSWKFPSVLLRTEVY